MPDDPFAIIANLNAPTRNRLLELLRAEVEPRLQVTTSGPAEGRQSAWLALQPGFGDELDLRAQPRGELWGILRQIVPEAQLGECWRNGRGSSPGITLHRDARYADTRAWIINLGLSRFSIWLRNDEPAPAPLRRDRRHRDFSEWHVQLSGGEVIEFNCKRLHGSETTAEERWGIGLWMLNKRWGS